MSETRRNLWVGSFVLFGLAAFGILIVLFGKVPTWITRGDTYELAIHFEFVSGIREGTLVTLGGKTWDLRPTFGALSRIESHLGVGLGALLMRFVEGKYGVTDITRILYEGIVAEAGNDAPEFTAVGEWVVAEGLERVAAPALNLLNAALLGFARFAQDSATDAVLPQEGRVRDRSTGIPAGRGCERRGAASTGCRMIRALAG